jgi:hypothetical protein
LRLFHGLAFPGLARHFIPSLVRRRTMLAKAFACPSPRNGPLQIQ